MELYCSTVKNGQTILCYDKITWISPLFHLEIKGKLWINQWLLGTFYEIDVTRTEWSTDPVKNIGDEGCQSTDVTGAPCCRVFCPLDFPWIYRHKQHTMSLLDMKSKGITIFISKARDIPLFVFLVKKKNYFSHLHIIKFTQWNRKADKNPQKKSYLIQGRPQRIWCHKQSPPMCIHCHFMPRELCDFISKRSVQCSCTIGKTGVVSYLAFLSSKNELI